MQRIWWGWPFDYSSLNSHIQSDYFKIMRCNLVIILAVIQICLWYFQLVFYVRIGGLEFVFALQLFIKIMLLSFVANKYVQFSGKWMLQYQKGFKIKVLQRCSRSMTNNGSFSMLITVHRYQYLMSSLFIILVMSLVLTSLYVIGHRVAAHTPPFCFTEFQ